MIAVSIAVCNGDHPRACGEHKERRNFRVAAIGSSPRMRGTRSRCRPCMTHSGIIPAHAGNTMCLRIAVILLRDHPRACGEHSCQFFLFSGVSGSSPRMRGTPQSPTAFGNPHGIIPAHAGNTLNVIRMCRIMWDHPRACGEHPPLRRLFRPITGSSPRMRGTHLLNEAQ